MSDFLLKKCDLLPRGFLFNWNGMKSETNIGAVHFIFKLCPHSIYFQLSGMWTLDEKSFLQWDSLQRRCDPLTQDIPCSTEMERQQNCDSISQFLHFCLQHIIFCWQTYPKTKYHSQLSVTSSCQEVFPSTETRGRPSGDPISQFESPVQYSFFTM